MYHGYVLTHILILNIYPGYILTYVSGNNVTDAENCPSKSWKSYFILFVYFFFKFDTDRLDQYGSKDKTK